MTGATASVAAQGAGFRAGNRWLLRDAAVELRPGELVGIVGPNGAGKSTLLRLLAGTWRTSAGRVRWGALGERPSAGELARHLALVPQEQLTARGFTAGEVVLMGRYVHLGRFEREGEKDFAAAREAMAATSTLALGDREVSTLSGGERQRVHIARGLAQETAALLLDEPTASLDVAHQLELMALLQRLAHEGGKAVAAVLHDLELAARWCDRLVVVGAGRVVADGRPGDVLTPQLLRDVFGVEARIYSDPASGSLRVWFERAAGATASAGPRVHVVAGHGRGGGVIRALVAAGFLVTVGPLSEGDRDRDTCEALGVPYLDAVDAGEPGPLVVAEHVRLAEAAEAVVACDLPAGRVRDAQAGAIGRARRLVAAGSWPGTSPAVRFTGEADVIDVICRALRLPAAGVSA
ncbi:ABC transporter ATP-binding protein [Tepidiforma sp.]|uniref:ABC transporter ATP-binding protein n=1 Tax=Tepidiforma sp. TaxID=2682230 RepID=UPI002ADE131D|nr:ABC transporter ATP-binding protein [Tepidiforma sp.]